MGFCVRYTNDACYGSLDPNVIPPNIKNIAGQKIGRKLNGRLNMSLTDQERDDERSYDRRLNLIREGNWPIDVTNNPGNNLSVKQGSVVSFVNQPTRFRASQLGNLC